MCHNCLAILQKLGLLSACHELPPPPGRAGSPRAAAELLRPPARRAHDFGRAPPARTDGTTLVSRCLRVGGVPCECVVGRGRRGVCVLRCPAPVTPPVRNVCACLPRPGYPPCSCPRARRAPWPLAQGAALTRNARSGATDASPGAAKSQPASAARARPTDRSAATAQHHHHLRLRYRHGQLHHRTPRTTSLREIGSTPRPLTPPAHHCASKVRAGSVLSQAPATLAEPIRLLCRSTWSG